MHSQLSIYTLGKVSNPWRNETFWEGLANLEGREKRNESGLLGDRRQWNVTKSVYFIIYPISVGRMKTTHACINIVNKQTKTLSEIITLICTVEAIVILRIRPWICFLVKLGTYLISVTFIGHNCVLPLLQTCALFMLSNKYRTQTSGIPEFTSEWV